MSDMAMGSICSIPTTGSISTGTSTGRSSSSIWRNMGVSGVSASASETGSSACGAFSTDEVLTLVRKDVSIGLGFTVPSAVISPTVAWYSFSTVVPLGTLLNRFLMSSALASASPTSNFTEVLSVPPTKPPPVALTYMGSPSLKKALSGTLEMKISLSSSMLYFS